MRYSLATAMIVLATIASVPSSAQRSGDYCPKVAREQMIPVVTVQKKVHDMGYEVRRVRYRRLS